MAVTLKMNKKIDRLDVIKTVASHGWTIEAILQDDGRKKFNDIVYAKIGAYIIHSSLDDGKIMAIYQPVMDEITIIGPNSESENKFKNKIGHILEKKRIGNLMKNNPKGYFNNLLNHSIWLTDEELTFLIDDLKNKCDPGLSYIA